MIMNRRNLLRYLLFLFLVCGLASCAKVPKRTCWRPWARILENSEEIVPGSTVSVEVKGDCQPLLGSDKLLENELSQILGNLLQRRGFIIADEGEDYSIRLSYLTVRNDMIVSRVYTVPTFSWAQTWGPYGYGIAAANMVGTTSTTVMGSVPVSNVRSQETYNHSLALQVLNRESSVVWQGEASWDDLELDLLSKANQVLQLIISGLPKASDIPPRVKAVRPEAAQNFFRIYCVDEWFSGPALPYRIIFQYRKQKEISGGSKTIPVPNTVKNPEAFAAYLDLVQTAEFALPLGTDNYSDPLDRNIWKWVGLGREYILEPGEQRVPILIELKGQEDGYEVSECKIATEEEYQVFLNRMARWQQALRDYFDVYQD